MEGHRTEKIQQTRGTSFVREEGGSVVAEGQGPGCPRLTRPVTVNPVELCFSVRSCLWLYWSGMNIEKTIAEIESLERLFAAPDTRPLSPSDISAANRRHDEKLAHSPWFRLWLSYGICCRPQPPTMELGKLDS